MLLLSIIHKCAMKCQNGKIYGDIQLFIMNKFSDGFFRWKKKMVLI